MSYRTGVLCSNGAAPHDKLCACGCGRTFRVGLNNPRQTYYSDKCRDLVQNERRRLALAKRRGKG